MKICHCKVGAFFGGTRYNSATQKLVKIPFIDIIVLNILQLLKLKFCQINKRGVQRRSGGDFRKLISRGTFIKHQRVNHRNQKDRHKKVHLRMVSIPYDFFPVKRVISWSSFLRRYWFKGRETDVNLFAIHYLVIVLVSKMIFSKFVHPH